MLGAPERRQQIDRQHKLPVVHPCRLLELSRASVYFTPVPVSDEELKLMRRLDELHLWYPFLCSRRLRDLLRAEGHRINRKHVQRLMRKLGITAIYPKPNTSKANAAHKTYPYLLGVIDHVASPVGCTDITYIPMAKGFLYLVAIMDWCSRKVLSWRLSNTLDSAFCVEALQEAIRCFGVPQLFNTDQGCQFTCAAWIDELKAHNIRISMDGKGR